MFKKILVISLCVLSLVAGDFIPIGIDTNTASLNYSNFSNSPLTVKSLEVKQTNTASFFQTTNNGITNAATVSKISISNTVFTLWIGYEGEFIAETNSTGGEVLGTVYFIRKP